MSNVSHLIPTVEEFREYAESPLGGGELPPAHGDKPPIAREIVGHAVGFTIGLANDRQVTFQTGFAEDEDDATVNARFDRIMHLADRQKAKYELVELRAELETHEKALARLDEDMPRVDADFERVQAQLDVQIDEFQRRAKEISEEWNAILLGKQQEVQMAQEKVYADALRSGRSGKQGPQGHQKMKIEGLQRAVEETLEMRAGALQAIQQAVESDLKAKEKNVAEREQHRGTVIAQRARYEEEIASRLAKIAEKEALLG